MLAAVGLGAVRKPSDQRATMLAVTDEFSDDAFQQVEQRQVVRLLSSRARGVGLRPPQ